MSWLLSLTIAAIFAIASAKMARTRNRNVPLWTVLGFVSGFVPIIILALIGNADHDDVSLAPGANHPQSEFGKDSILSVRDVSVVFGGIVALNGVSFDMKQGQILGLIGPNGAGKTTLFNCLSRLYQPSKGDILMQGKSILTRQASQIAEAGIGRTFQNVALFPRLTVRDNIRIGGHCRTKSDFISDALKLPWVRREEAALNEKVDEILTYLDLHSVADREVAGLPFGTQKRVELGRALAAEPKILLLDEPAGGLNHEEVHSLATLIRRIRDERKMTVLLVEHHMGLVMSIADHVVALNFGKKLAEGTPAAVQSDPDVITAYLGSKDQ